MNLKAGATYQNSRGAILIVDKFYQGGMGRPHTLGDIWLAHAPDEMFGPTPYLVTSTSMEECGYVKIKGV